MEIHIGQLVGKILDKKGIAKAELGRRINKARQTVDDIIDRKSMDIELLLNISEAIEYDFLRDVYAAECTEKLDTLAEPREAYLPQPTKPMVTISISVPENELNGGTVREVMLKHLQ